MTDWISPPVWSALKVPMSGQSLLAAVHPGVLTKAYGALRNKVHYRCWPDVELVWSFCINPPGAGVYVSERLLQEDDIQNPFRLQAVDPLGRFFQLWGNILEVHPRGLDWESPDPVLPDPKVYQSVRRFFENALQVVPKLLLYMYDLEEEGFWSGERDLVPRKRPLSSQAPGENLGHKFHWPVAPFLDVFTDVGFEGQDAVRRRVSALSGMALLKTVKSVIDCRRRPKRGRSGNDA